MTSVIDRPAVYKGRFKHVQEQGSRTIITYHWNSGYNAEHCLSIKKDAFDFLQAMEVSSGYFKRESSTSYSMGKYPIYPPIKFTVYRHSDPGFPHDHVSGKHDAFEPCHIQCTLLPHVMTDMQRRSWEQLFSKAGHKADPGRCIMFRKHSDWLCTPISGTSRKSIEISSLSYVYLDMMNRWMAQAARIFFQFECAWKRHELQLTSFSVLFGDASTHGTNVVMDFTDQWSLAFIQRPSEKGKPTFATQEQVLHLSSRLIPPQRPVIFWRNLGKRGDTDISLKCDQCVKVDVIRDMDAARAQCAELRKSYPCGGVIVVQERAGSAGAAETLAHRMGLGWSILSLQEHASFVHAGEAAVIPVTQMNVESVIDHVLAADNPRRYAARQLMREHPLLLQ